MLQKLFGTKHTRDLKKLRPLLGKINNFEPELQKLSDEQLKAQTEKFKQLIADGKSLDSLLPEAFATVREASVRVLSMRHYDVQMVGGIVLFQGRIAEMKTGEGKTLTATLPLYLKGLTEKGAHLVTVNDYLAQRDAKDMGELFNWLGLSVGCIISDMDDEDRKKAYASDITYGTNNEFGFDYLRDNMKFDLDEYVQRDHHYCIVDEVDSILIDEARTPLIISGPSEGDVNIYSQVDRFIPQLEKAKHFTVDEKSKTAVLTDEGIGHLQKISGLDDLYDIKNTEFLHHINQALRAHALFERDKDYVVKEGEIIIVDEFTGRLKTGSRWSDGLHHAIEAKEKVQVKRENQTLASITFQNYFKLYDKLAGMTGTADTEAEEFRKIYNLDVVVIPTNEPMIRDDMPDAIYKNREGKFHAVAELVKELHKKGQPTLIGTVSIEASEGLSQTLTKAKIPHNVLNAKQHGKEAEIIVNAGAKGSVTIATNMAGRGTDIKLGHEVKQLGGLFIVGTERHESRRIDNQLRGRSGRQGDPGASKFFLCLEDDLMRIFGSDRIKGIMGTLGMKEDEAIEHKMISRQIEKAQKKVEGHNFEIRKHLLDYDNVMNQQRRVIYKIRRDILQDKGNLEFIHEMIEDVSHDLVESYRPQDKVPLESWPWEEMKVGFKNTFHSSHEISSQECQTKHDGALEKYFISLTKQQLEAKCAEYDDEQVRLATREVLLTVFDQHWKDHLLAMDHMKEGINLRAYAQKDPLSEYKHEAFHLFDQMKMTIKKSVVDKMFGMRLYTPEEIEEIKKQQEAMLKAQLEAHKSAQKSENKPVKRKSKKVGRNEPCPCGSGKKYKHCHGS